MLVSLEFELDFVEGVVRIVIADGAAHLELFIGHVHDADDFSFFVHFKFVVGPADARFLHFDIDDRDTREEQILKITCSFQPVFQPYILF